MKKPIPDEYGVSVAAHGGDALTSGRPEWLDSLPGPLGPTYKLVSCTLKKNMQPMSHVPTGGSTEAHRQDLKASPYLVAIPNKPTLEGEKIKLNTRPNKPAQQQ